MKLAIIGAGKLGRTILSGIDSSESFRPDHVVVTARRDSSKRRLQEGFAATVANSNVEAVAGSDVVLLCVKPQTLPKLLQEIAPELRPDHLLISTAAGTSTQWIEAQLEQDCPVVRAMPNTPARVGAAMTAIAGGSCAEQDHLDTASAIFSAVGRTMILEERFFDAVTALSASGTAFLYLVYEALADGGVKAGLPRDVAFELVAQTALGAARMVLETGDHPAVLKDAVTTPAGCTTDGLMALEAGGVRVAMINAVVEAARRAGELAPN